MLSMAEQDIGPIDYLALEFPEAKITGEGFAALLDLVDRGIIRILDLRFVIGGPDGTFSGVALADLDHDGVLDLAVFDGVSSGLLGDEDLADAAALVPEGTAVGVMIYENTWAGPFVTAMRNHGARVLADGRIPVETVIAALDSLDAAEA